MESTPQYLDRPVMSLSPLGDGRECFVFEVIYRNKKFGSFKLRDEFVEFILNHGFCDRCLEKIATSSHLKECKKPQKSSRLCSSNHYHLYRHIPFEFMAEFKTLWGQEQRRYRSFYRTSKLGKIPLPPEEILRQLKGRQDNRCYYCFNEFKASPPNLKPNLDHFVSAANGGSNSVLNLVYACGKCNREKCSENGERYITLKMPTELFPNDIRRNITKMRKSVGEWKEQLMEPSTSR